MIRVCMMGLGKTGREIARVLMGQDDIRLAAVVCSPGSSKKGMDVGEIIGSGRTGIVIDSADNLEEIIFKAKPEVVIDFTNPEAALRNARVFSRMKVNIVIGTTGFSKMALKKLFVLTKKYRNGIVYAPNITLGVNVLMLLSNLAASILNNYDFHITEIHHKRKKDAPSGTALKIAGEIEKGLKEAGSDVIPGTVPITAVRAGGVIGKHDVMMIGEEDKIEISHESFSRRAFAEGAIRAVRFLHKKTGYFEMVDVLGLSNILSNYVEKEKHLVNRRHIHYDRGTDKPQQSWA